MKKTIVALLTLFAVFEGIYVMGAGTYQPQNLGYVNMAYSSATVTAIQNSTATMIGQTYWCYNCTANGAVGTPCSSTGTTVWNQFILSTGTICK